MVFETGFSQRKRYPGKKSQTFQSRMDVSRKLWCTHYGKGVADMFYCEGDDTRLEWMSFDRTKWYPGTITKPLDVLPFESSSMSTHNGAFSTCCVHLPIFIPAALIGF
jgi:hypothetical protein